MRWLRSALVLLVAALVAGGALAVTVWQSGPTSEAGEPPAALEDGIETTTRLSPKNPMFADTIRAIVDVELDPARVDEESVEIATDFAPWGAVGPPERTRRDVGGRTYLRTEYTIRCTTGPCLPSGATTASNLSPARITYTRIDDDVEGQRRRTLTATWPLLVVYSRFTALQQDTRSTTTTSQADLVSLPVVSYRVAPGVLVAMFGVLAALLAGAGAALLYVAWPRRAPAPPPEPEPEPQPSLTPLEQALALLEESALAEGASEQRRALELVAEELEEWGDDELSGAAKVLAWSAGAPRLEQTTELAARVRAELEQELLARAELERNGAGSAP